MTKVTTFHQAFKETLPRARDTKRTIKRMIGKTGKTRKTSKNGQIPSHSYPISNRRRKANSTRVKKKARLHPISKPVCSSSHSLASR